MSEVLRPASLSQQTDQVLADLVAEITDRLHAGERVDLEEYLARCPEYAERLRRLLPALEVLDGLPSATGPDGPVASEERGAGAAVPGTLGDFRMVREVGRGGMGVVYEAEQRSLRRRVALKVLPLAAALDPRQLQRFHTEAQAAACLHHTSIVPVYYVGCERAIHFYAMQFIEGQSLAALIDELRQPDKPKEPRGARITQENNEEAKRNDSQPGTDAPYSASGLFPRASRGENDSTLTGPAAVLSTERSARGTGYSRTVARLGVQAVEALEHAHQQGVIHRDIKPANLLIDGLGDLWVTDFGLARLQTDAGLTMSGDLVGTLRYMSPEQALAQRVVVDHRTDLYSLGATLYELLTLQPAFPGSDR
jgi:serine/threonine-protein kinase